MQRQFSKAPTKTYILKVSFNHLGEELTVGLSGGLEIFFFMKSVPSVERVHLILVPLSVKFDLKSLFLVLFYLLRTNLEFVRTLTKANSYIVCNFKTKEHSNEQFNYILEL